MFVDDISSASDNSDRRLVAWKLLVGLRPAENEKVAKDAVVIIVDDDESFRNAIKRLINAVGFSVKDYASAEEFLISGPVDEVGCLILDVRLPGMSGLELQNRLIIDKWQIPTVFISAHANPNDRARAFEAHAVDFLQKPFT